MIWKLLFAHFLTDFVFQSFEIATNKHDYKKVLLHVFVFFALSILFFVCELSLTKILVFLLLSASHGIVDYLKTKLLNEKLKKFGYLFFIIDQIIHISLLSGATVYISQSRIDLLSIYSIFTNINIWSYLSIIIVVLFGGSFFTESVLSSFHPENDDVKIDKLGRVIGVFERILIMFAIFTTTYSLIGLVIAAKSAARFKSIKDDSDLTSEKFIVGTFSSVTWAIVFTYLLQLLSEFTIIISNMV